MVQEEIVPMGALAAAYWIAWALVVAYLGRLGLQNRRLDRRLEELEAAASGHAGRGDCRAA